MALSLENSLNVKRKAFNQLHQFDAETRRFIKALFEVLAERGVTQLQFVPFDNLTGTDTVIADAACKLYALVLKKETATAAFFKASDHATTSSSTAPEIELEQNAIREDVLAFPKGYAQGSGLTVSSDTTSDGATGSTAGDGATGFAILGAA